MPRNRPTPGSPEDWLNRAKGDLALARAPLPEAGFYEDLCFHAQQAAEKALESVYVKHGWMFRYVHDLDELITGLKKHALQVPPSIEEAASLTPYAFEARYPSVAEPVTEEEHRSAVALAERVVEWAEKIVEGQGA